MIKALIIDDEKPARERVVFFLKERDDIFLVGEAQNGEEGLLLIESERPELIFLDIQMPKLDGFRMLEKCSYTPKVIFISAYDRHALHAFEVNAVDYLLKPYSRERFESAVNKVLEGYRGKDDWEKKITSLINSYKCNKEYLEQITVKQGYTFKVFNVEEIDFFRMDDGLLYLLSHGQKILIETPINQLEGRLSPQFFLRVHRNSLVNLKKVKEVIPWGRNRLVLDFGKSGSVHVSREKIKILKKRIGIKI